MDVPDQLKASAAALLGPGETLQAAIWAQTLNPYWVPITPLRVVLGPSSPYRVIVATDRRLLLLRGNRWRVRASREILAELPRRTRIGPAGGLWHRTDAFGEHLYIQRRFHREVASADAAL
jgi:hypothetical protein